MRILSFDTSTSNLYACCADGANILSEQILICNPENRQFAASLIMPTLAGLLQKIGWQKEDIELMVVGIGPGTFTGTRIAVVTARTLSQALNLPLLGINRFQCYAFKEKLETFPAAMILPAGKKQYFCAHLTSNVLMDSSSPMNTHHVLEDGLLDHLENFDRVYIDNAALAIAGSEPGNKSTDSWHVLPDLANPAVTQALFAFAKIGLLSGRKENIEAKPFLLKQFPYQLLRPLYIRNPSVTVKASSSKVN